MPLVADLEQSNVARLPDSGHSPGAPGWINQVISISCFETHQGCNFSSVAAVAVEPCFPLALLIRVGQQDIIRENT